MLKVSCKLAVSHWFRVRFTQQIACRRKTRRVYKVKGMVTNTHTHRSTRSSLGGVLEGAKLVMREL